MIRDVRPVATGMNEMWLGVRKYQTVQAKEHPFICCCSEAENLPYWKVLDNGTDSSKGRSKALPPAHDGMCFIKDQQADGHLR